MTNKDIITMLEVIHGDMHDVQINVERGTWNDLNALDAIIKMLGNHIAYAQNLLNEMEPF